MSDERYYPGSKRKIPDRRTPPPEAPTGAKAGWRDFPRRQYLYQGAMTDFYAVGALAHALNRKPVTIRLWERTGVLPTARFRSPKGQRLYTAEQIEGIEAIARTLGIIDGAAPTPEFTRQVLELFRPTREAI